MRMSFVSILTLVVERAQSRKRLFGLAFAFLLAAAPAAFPESEPVPPPPDIATLLAVRLAGPDRVNLNWIDGSGPFVVVRSENPEFDDATAVYLSRNLAGATIDDTTALLDTKLYFYQVADSLAEPYVINFTPAAPVIGDTVTFNGWGFGTGTVELAVGGKFHPLSLIDASSASFTTPLSTSSGFATVFSENGASTPVRFLANLGTGFTNLWSVGVDLNHDLYVGEGTPMNRIWRIDLATGVKTQCGTGATPVSLARNESGDFLFTTHNYTASNVGTLRALNPIACTVATWGTTGTSTSDPVDGRATAYDRSGANDGWGFILDHYGDRIRKKQNGVGVDKFWMTGLGLGGNGATASEPAGFVFNTAGHFFFTRPNEIAHYDETKTFVENWVTGDGLNRPAGMDIDDLGYLWVANRNSNNVLRVRFPPLGTRKIYQKILAEEGPTLPRAVVTDRDPADPDGPFLYAYVANATGVYRFRIGDQVQIHVKVLREALVSNLIPFIPWPISEAKMIKIVEADMRNARQLFLQCGLQITLLGIEFVDDPNVKNGEVERGTNDAQGYHMSAQELAILTTQRHSDPAVINVYYVKNFLTNTSLLSTDKVGLTYSNDINVDSAGNPISNAALGGILIARRAATAPPGSSYNARPSKIVPAHEVGHLLQNLSTPTFDGEHYFGSGDLDKLMYFQDGRNRKIITPANCTEMTTNTDEHDLYVDNF